MYVPAVMMLVLLPFVDQLKVIAITYGLILVTNIADEVFPKMPVAVITNSQSDKIDLETCPGGYVIVRRMNYGEKLLRDGMAAKFLMSGSAKDSSMQGEIDMQTEEVALWEFANLIVEHNLTDANEVALNFKVKAHVKMLDPNVGDEIGRLIDAQNAAQNSEEVKNS
jgi:hypothetical protein